MASVFLSYDHEDGGRARSIAEALEGVGHSVWSDRHIRGGSQFNKEIEEALERADAIVVLWSKRSVESAWVRDEAAVARDSGRLIPVGIDPIKPPLGFRQYQNINLSHWSGRGKAPVGELLTAIDGLKRQDVVPNAAPAPRARPRFVLPRRPLLIALLIAGILAGGAAAWKLMVRPAVPIVAVQTAEQNALAKTFARDLLVRLGSLQGPRADAIRLVEGGSGQKADLVFQVGGSRERQQSNASLMLLTGNDRASLWSKDFRQPLSQESNLKQQLAFTAAQVLSCALEGLGGKHQGLRQQTLKLYVNGCATLSEIGLGAQFAVVAAQFQRVTQQAPRFEGGWAKLLTAETEVALSGFEDTRDRLKQHIAKARQISPRMAEAYRAEILLLPSNAYAQRMTLADKSVSLNPDDALPLSVRSQELLAIGRMDDAIGDARTAAQFDPLSPKARADYILTLNYAGKREIALAELHKADDLWPGSKILDGAHFAIDLRTGDPGAALRLIRTGMLGQQWPETESYLEARIDPTPAKVEHAVQQALSLYRREPQVGTLANLMQIMGQFHREEQLLRLLLDAPTGDLIDAMRVTFRPTLANFWKDPRSLLVAKRAGLLHFWQTSGKWPDLCSQGDLPYDCKKEAAKVST
jgi:tetratricopeptide (TPR) repeat protein